MSDPTQGAYSALQTPSWFQRAASRQEGNRGGEGREGLGGEGRGERMGKGNGEGRERGKVGG